MQNYFSGQLYRRVKLKSEALINKLRSFHYAIGILNNQQNDPLCCQCSAFARTSEAIVDGFIKFDTNHGSERKSLPEEFSLLFMDIRDKITVIEAPEEPLRQKEGNCHLPKGVCFTKEITAFLQKT